MERIVMIYIDCEKIDNQKQTFHKMNHLIASNHKVIIDGIQEATSFCNTEFLSCKQEQMMHYIADQMKEYQLHIDVTLDYLFQIVIKGYEEVETGNLQSISLLEGK